MVPIGTIVKLLISRRSALADGIRCRAIQRWEMPSPRPRLIPAARA
jgi:hypothetical protein